MRKPLALLGAIVLIGTGLFATSASAVNAAAASTTIQSKHNGRCLTLAHYNAGDGASVHMYDCNGAPTQQWTFEGGRIRSAYSGKCLVPAIGNADNGASLTLYTCDQNAHWYRPTGTGRIRTWLNGNRCMEIAGANLWQGAAVQLWDCNGGAHQNWWSGV